MTDVKIAPSTLSCPLAELQGYIKELEVSGADWLHCDIMDGEFVPEKTFDETILSLISKRTKMPMDVHLMVKKPEEKIVKYTKAGAKILTVHYEAFDSKVVLINTLQKMRELGVKVGLSIKPDSNLEDIYKYLPLVDVILVMSVTPGKSGQKFQKEAISRIALLHNYRKQTGLEYLIEVDGGINLDNSANVITAGADILVSGNTIYNAEDKKVVIQKLRGK